MNIKSLNPILFLAITFAAFSEYQTSEVTSSHYLYNILDKNFDYSNEFQEITSDNSSRDLPSLVTFDIDGLESCDMISVAGSWNGFNVFSTTSENGMTATIPEGEHQFNILCIDTSNANWQNDVWANSYNYYAPFGSECSSEFNVNYTLNVSGIGLPFTVSYCAGTCDESCDESTELPSIVSFDLGGFEHCDRVHVTGTFDGWSGWGVNPDTYNYSRVIPSGEHGFRILCVDTSSPDWNLNVYANSVFYYPPLYGDCTGYDDFGYNYYSFAVDGDGNPINQSYYAGTCNPNECDSIVDECGECDGDNTTCLDECGVINGYGINENGWQVATTEEGYIQACYWGGVYEENIAWGYGEYTTLEDCIFQCESNPDCTSIEFSDHLEICAFWFNDACDLTAEVNPVQLFTANFLGEAPFYTYQYTGECNCEGDIIDEYGLCGGCTAGDVNADISIDVLDVVSIVNFVLLTDFPTDYESCASDYNQDSGIDVLDIVQLVNIILN